MSTPTHQAIDASHLQSQLAWDKMQGLIPAVVVDAITGAVLMVAWCNQEAIDTTLRTGKVTFFSRSRQALWTKGETSGNTLALQRMRSDCDGDTLLIEALPAGPVCHTGTFSCFDAGSEARSGQSQAVNPLGFLGQLEHTIAARKRDDNTQDSYTAQLFARGLAKIAQKVGEEGVEVALAGVLDSREDLINESADLMYHLLVLLAAQNVPLSEVVRRLHERHTA